MEQLYFVVHTHWDREWYQPFQQMRARLVAMADRMIPMVESGEIPFFHFDGQTIVLDDYLEIRPENAKRLRALIKAGKVQVGPWYVLADSFLVSGESLIRNLEIGIASARRFGRYLNVGYLPDQFGHIAQLPQILAQFGFSTAALWRGVGADVTRNRFIWEAPDGSAVTAIYMPYGYSNGANLPLDTVESFLARIETIIRRERPFAPDSPILVMNGTDHASPDGRLVARIREARESAGIEFEVGPLEEFARHCHGLGSDGIPRHRGELRSPLRAHLLPGVTSARTWIKQRDFRNCYLLERIADPIAAIANARGRGDGVDEWLDAAWRFELQNHPHDSICGCSVDQVHADMRYRFDQAEMLAETAIRRATSAIFADTPASRAAIAVFNPTFARCAVVSGEVELADPGASYAVQTAGCRIPAAVDGAGAERSTEFEMPASELKPLVAALSHPSLFGRTINRYELRCESERRARLDLHVSRAALGDLDLAEFRDRIRREIPDDAMVSIRATAAARATISFAAYGLAQAGFSRFELVRDERSEPNPGAKDDSISNDYYRVTPTARGLRIEDLARDSLFELGFEDDGDRGDEYNFDPVPGDTPIAEPASVVMRGCEAGGPRKRLAIELVYEIAESLDPDRSRRAARKAPLKIELAATLWAGLDRVDFEARVTNQSRDHRLRAALRTPVRSSSALHDSAFGVVTRPLRASEPPGTEDIYPTIPHRTWSAVESDRVSTALFSRGLYEVEARAEPGGTVVLLTMLRCVGWLSRSDLAMRRGGAGPELETPGAQELGEHRFEFAMASYRGSYVDSAIAERAAAYAFPPRMFYGAACDESLIRCDNPSVAFSTARPTKRAGVYRVRVYSVSPKPEKASFGFPDGVRARIVDLAGRPIRGRIANRGGELRVEMRPFEIVTFEVARGR